MSNNFDMKRYVRCPGAQPSVPASVRGNAPECRAEYCMPNITGCEGMWCHQIQRKVETLSDISGIPDGRPGKAPRTRYPSVQAREWHRHIHTYDRGLRH